MKKNTRWPVFTKTRALTVFQPAVPLRAVEVSAWTEGQGRPDADPGAVRTEQEELHVLGIEATVRERYTHPPIPADQRDPRIATAREKDIQEAGYTLDMGGGVPEYSVLVWSQEYQSPVTVGEYESDNTKIVVAPLGLPPETWERMLKEAETEVIRRVKSDQERREAEKR